jgi:hypothetical protein
MENDIEPFRKASTIDDDFTRTIFSDYPFHLLAKLEADTLKNMLSAATALANNVLPVPGGPNNRIPFIAFRIPLKN